MSTRQRKQSKIRPLLLPACCLLILGYFAYHAVPTNIEAHRAFRFHVVSLWGRALRRRSQKDGTTWKRILKIADEFLPKPRILHPWPNQRFAVKHPR